MNSAPGRSLGFLGLPLAYDLFRICVPARRAVLRQMRHHCDGNDLHRQLMELLARANLKSCRLTSLAMACSPDLLASTSSASFSPPRSFGHQQRCGVCGPCAGLGLALVPIGPASVRSLRQVLGSH